MYKLSDNGIIDLRTMAFIPEDPGNRYYQEYLQWVNEGNTPISKDIPIEAIDLTTFTIDENKLFEIKKKQKLNELNQLTTDYIHNYYPELKQRSDIVDKEYYSNYLLSYGIDESEFRKSIKDSVINIYDNNSDFNTELTNIKNSYPVPVDSNNNPIADENIWNKAIEQLLKVAIRVEFINRIKIEYYELKRLIDTAVTLSDLENIEITFKTVLPEI